MKLARSAALGAVLLVISGVGAFACASKDKKPTAAHPASDAPPTEDTPAHVDEPAEPPPPADPFAGISGDPSVGFAGAEQLLRDAIATDLELPAFDVACMRGADALDAPADLDARLERLAGEQRVALGRVRFVRIERDPTTTTDRSAARLCRPVREDAILYAPLFREKERASTWLVDAGADVSGSLRKLLERAASERAQAAGPPRAIVVRGKVVAVALPVARRE